MDGTKWLRIQGAYTKNFDLYQDDVLSIDDCEQICYDNINCKAIVYYGKTDHG